MLFSDTYREPATNGRAMLREKGSKFLAFSFLVKSEAEVKIKLQEVKVFYPDATHHCYAYVIHPDKSAQRASDDGEPSNSAGKPILRAIMSADATNVLVVVVRYFGGTMLGIPGLINAYGEAAKLALANAELAERYIEDTYEITSAFENEQEIHRLISAFDARIIGHKYTEKVMFNLAVKRSAALNFEKKAMNNYLLEIKKSIYT